MKRGEYLGARVDVPRIAVDHERAEGERRCSQQPPAHVELSPTREVAGEERQDEQAQVAEEPIRLFVGEVGRKARDLDRQGGRRTEEERLEPATGRAGRLVVGADQELLPQPTAVLPREL